MASSSITYAIEPCPMENWLATSSDIADEIADQARQERSA